MTDADPDPARSSSNGQSGDEDGTVRVWLVERTFSDDELNIVILIYATPDGERYYRKERALTSFSGPSRVTTAALTVPVDDTGAVTDPERREWYATEAERMASSHDPDDTI